MVYNSNSDNSDYESKYIKGDYYLKKIADLLEQIDIYKQSMIQEKREILNLSERIHALYLLISNELNPKEKQTQQKKFCSMVQENNYCANFRSTQKPW